MIIEELKAETNNSELKEKYRVLGLESDVQDEEVIKEVIKVVGKHELTVDRASRVLKDARKLLPFLSKLVLR